MSINANSNVIEAIATVLGGGAGGGRIPRGGSAPLSISYAVVGGGGKGTLQQGGGGGYVETGSITLGLSVPYTIIVGQGESAGTSQSAESSSFIGPNPAGGNFDIKAAGAIGSTSGEPAANLPGTTDVLAGSFWGGGGGGATTAGTNGVNPNPGPGGLGVALFLNGVAYKGFGGGGGGGLRNLAGGAGAVGNDGGGDGGGQTNFATSGVSGSGGGGGAWGNAGPQTNGASGSVVIAYPTPSSTASGISYGVGGTITTGSFGGVDYTIHTFYENGTFQTLVR